MNRICQVFGHKFPEKLPENIPPGYGNVSCIRKGCNGDMSVHCKDSQKDYDARVSHSKYEDTFWTSDAWSNIKIVLLGILAAFGVLALIVIPAIILNKLSCNSYAKFVEVPVQWNFWTSCMAKHPQFGWMPIDEFFRNVNVTLPK
jgi:hypothetical protein